MTCPKPPAQKRCRARLCPQRRLCSPRSSSLRRRLPVPGTPHVPSDAPALACALPPAQSVLHSPFISVFNSCSFFSPWAKGHLCKEAFPGSPMLCGPLATSNTQLLWRGDAPTFQKGLDHTFARSWWESAAVLALCAGQQAWLLSWVSPLHPETSACGRSPPLPFAGFVVSTLILRVGAGLIIGQVGLWGLHGEALDTVSGGALPVWPQRFPLCLSKTWGPTLSSGLTLHAKASQTICDEELAIFSPNHPGPICL